MCGTEEDRGFKRKEEVEVRKEVGGSEGGPEGVGGMRSERRKSKRRKMRN